MSLKKDFHDLLTTERAKSGRIPFLLNDLVIEEQLCQMKCSYCLTEEFKLLMAVPDARERLTTDKREEWHNVLRHFHAQVDAPILRLSGGEFFWLKNSTDFVEECANLYETVQVISNGLLLHTKRLTALADHPNCQLSVSIDGHTAEMNRYRFPAQQVERKLDIVLRNLDAAVALGIKVEVQTVLTDANIDGQVDFCSYLRDRYAGRVLLYFFPVRGKVAEKMAPPPTLAFDSLVARYDEFESVLPPKAYVAHIARQIVQGFRTLPCYITSFMGQLFGNGDFAACPSEWIEPICNVMDTPVVLSEKVLVDRHYDFFLQERPRFKLCRPCATPYDVLNLYFLDEVSDEEMTRCFLYSGPRSLLRLKQLKTSYAQAYAASVSHRMGADQGARIATANIT